MVKQHVTCPRLWLGSQSHWQEMEVFGFPCQAISMLILQKKLQEYYREESYHTVPREDSSIPSNWILSNKSRTWIEKDKN